MMDSGNGVIAYWIVSSLLFLYAIGAGIEFGAGGYALWTLRSSRAQSVQRAIFGWMSPIWETTNVFLIGFVVGLVAFFPASISYYAQPLLYPAALGLVMLILRGLLFTQLYQNRHENQPWSRALFGLTSLLVPVLFVAFFAVSLGAGLTSPLMSSPIYWTLVLLALAGTFQLGGTFLAWYGRQQLAEPAEAQRLFIRGAGVGTALLLVGHILLVALTRSALPRFGAALFSPLNVTLWLAGWVLLAVAGVDLARAGWEKPNAATGKANQPSGPDTGSLGWPLTLSLLSTLFFLVAYGAAHLPYLAEAVPPAASLSVQQAVVNAPMYRSLLVVLMAGGAVILPALVLLYGLFLARPAQAGRSAPAGRPPLARQD